MREREAHALEVSKKVTEMQRKIAKTNCKIPTYTDEQEAECQKIIDDCKAIDEELDRMTYLEERAQDVVLDMMEMQARLDAVNAGVQVVIKPAPRQPELILQEARQLNHRLLELQAEFAEWQSRQPKITAH